MEENIPISNIHTEEIYFTKSKCSHMEWMKYRDLGWQKKINWTRKMKLRWKRKQNHMVSFTIHILSMMAYGQRSNVVFTLCGPKGNQIPWVQMHAVAHSAGLHLCSPRGSMAAFSGVLIIRLEEQLQFFFFLSIARSQIG